MKKFILLAVMLVVSVTLFMSYNQEIIDTAPYYLPTPVQHSYVFTAVNNGVYGSMVGNYSYGFLNNHGLQMRYIQPDSDGSTDDLSFGTTAEYYQIEQYKNKTVVDGSARWMIYLSKVNLGGIFFSLLDKLLEKFHLTQLTKLYIMHGLSSVAAISMLMILAYWCYKEFGLITSIVVCVSFIGYRYFAPIGSGLSNSAFSCLFALGITTLLLMREENKQTKAKWWAECIIIFFAIMLKAMMGYEYIPTVMVSATVMYFYYALSRQWNFWYFIKRFIRICISAVAGLATTLLIHYIQLTSYFNSSKKGFQYLLESFGKRSSGNSAVAESEPDIWVNATVWKVIRKYHFFTNENGQGLVFDFSLLDMTIIWIVLCAIALISYLIINKSKNMNEESNTSFRKMFALIICSIIAAIGWISTFVVLKQHSLIHIMFTTVIFYCPFVPLIFTMAGYQLQQLLSPTTKIEKV